jgi:CelD/BcsL family acetyltransferase involved in cellulose biosynthesis
LTKDEQVLARLLEWKSSQYVRTGAEDEFAVAWRRDLLRRLIGVNRTRFAGTLSALFAGDRLVAAHMGIRSRRVWQWLVPAYDPTYAAYSPGAILLLHMAEVAPDIGIEILDLGRGEHGYKDRFRTDDIAIAAGFVASSAWRQARRTLVETSSERLHEMAQRGPLGPERPIGSALRAVRVGLPPRFRDR